MSALNPHASLLYDWNYQRSINDSQIAKLTVWILNSGKNRCHGRYATNVLIPPLVCKEGQEPLFYGGQLKRESASTSGYHLDNVLTSL